MRVMELTGSLERVRAESIAEAESLQSKIGVLTAEREEQIAKVVEAGLKISKLEQAEQLLAGKVAMTEGKVEECAKYEVETQILHKKTALLETEIQSLQTSL